MVHTPDWWTKEDAALFDAAPELLEACEAVVKSAVDANGCNWCHYAGAQWEHADWCPIPSAIAAIEKAEGDR